MRRLASPGGEPADESPPRPHHLADPETGHCRERHGLVVGTVGRGVVMRRPSMRSRRSNPTATMRAPRPYESRAPNDLGAGFAIQMAPNLGILSETSST